MLTSIAVLSVALAGPCDAPTISPEMFRSWFETAMTKELAMPKKVAREAGRYRYVFVGGLLNESLGQEFRATARDLKDRGVSKKAIHIIQPSSHNSIQENAEAFRAEFLEVAKLGPEPLVIIAHSRGACDAMLFALDDPDFIQQRVRAMFLIQAPFGGSGLADYVMGEGPALDPSLKVVPRIVAKAVGGFERYLISQGKHGGIAEMTRESSHRFWHECISAHPDSVTVVGPKTFYIEGETNSRRLKLFLRATAAYLHVHYGPNDGVVARGDQSLKALGTSLGVYDAGHTDLTRKSPGSRQGKRTRKALIDAIIMAVGQPDVS